jgi:hypothetical protein
MTGSGVIAAIMPGKCAAPPAYDDPETPRGGRAREGGHQSGRAVGGGYGYVVGDLEGLEDREAGFEHGEVGVGAHCYGDEGLGAL